MSMISDLSTGESLRIEIVGLGVMPKAPLSDEAQQAIRNSDVILGSSRQLCLVEHLIKDQGTSAFPPFSQLPQWIQQQQASGMKKLVVLASGDPLFYGVGRWFAQRFSRQQLTFHPAVSSLQAACHRLGISLQDTQVISLHGRPLASLRRTLKQHQTVLALTDDKSKPSHIAAELLDMGFTQGRVHICERLGYQDEKVSSYSVTDRALHTNTFNPLHVTVIESGTCQKYVPEFPGIPDDEFATDGEKGKGLLTKRAVRLNILSQLQPASQDVIWDIGAGCGSVAIELALWQRQHQIFAIEHHPQRLACLKENREKFGVEQTLQIVAGRAPEVLNTLAIPNKIFIGGSDGELLNILSYSWDRLPPNGVLVATAVTETSKQILLGFCERLDQTVAEFESFQIQINGSDNLAGQLLYRPNLPVTLFKWTKAKANALRYSNHEVR